MNIKECAELIGVTQQGIYKRLKNHGISPASLKDKATGQLTDDGLKTLSQLFGLDLDNQSTGDDKVDTALQERVETLTTEINQLNKQVEFLNEKVEMLQRERDSLQQQLYQANQLHMMALQRIPALPQPVEDDKQGHSDRGLRGWWNRIKRSNRP